MHFIDNDDVTVCGCHIMRMYVMRCDVGVCVVLVVLVVVVVGYC